MKTVCTALRYRILSEKSLKIQFTFKYVSNRPALLWQTQIKTIEFGLNDTIKRKKSYWYLTHFHPLIWIFKRFWCPKWFWEFFCHKKSTLLNHFYLKYALIDWKLSCQMATLFLNDLQAERFHFIYWHVCRPTSCCFVHETAVKLILILIQFLLLYVSRLEVLFQ